jgi:nucleotide-binding universal stress UspA family protein
MGLVRNGGRINFSVTAPDGSDLPIRAAIYSLERLEEHAESLAAEHRLSRDSSRGPGLPVLRLTTVDGKSVAERILEIAHDEQADLIVIGTHGRQGAERLVLGSVAQAVAGSSQVPVQIIPVRVREPNQFADRWRRALGVTK